MNRTGKTRSIHLRLLGASLCILPLFLGITAWILDRAFANYQIEAHRESMRLQQVLLAKAADWNGKSWVIEGLDEPRLNLLGSGLYAFVFSTAGDILWQSPSAELIGELPDPPGTVSETAGTLGLLETKFGENRLEECSIQGPHFCQGTRVSWGSNGPESLFLIVESQAPMIAARKAWRQYLLLLSLGTAGLLLLAQSLIFRWGLAPLRKISAAIGLLERGESDRLEGSYPDELVPLSDNINILLASERRRRERVRNTMDRLTHVLKTPLMLIRNSSYEDREFREMTQEQVTRMLSIVEGELAKARLDGRKADILGKPVLVKPVLLRIADAYRRLPRRSAEAETAGELVIDTSGISPKAVFHGEERDLQDLFGSILENSLKYCRTRIQVTASQQFEAGSQWLLITVGDDGHGIPEGYEQEILQRGGRADSANSGQGLGLSIVVEIISAYGGSLHSENSELGGALFVIRLPGAAPPTT